MIEVRDQLGTPLEPIAVGAAQAAELFGISERKWRSMDVAGQVPLAIRLGEQPRWCVAELRAWAACGAPSRVEWESIKPQDGAAC